ncbi:uncharacterized protein LOC142231867 [Haematobia irritans]|uniref:uncharacterized protein LOC142231867 n=1 Tax=Haematobia irritans TaxID=7368 RepID=UPI003F4FC4CC
MNTNKNCESDGEVRIELETTAAASCDIESGGINNDSEILKDETLIGQSSRIFPQEMLDILKLQQEMLDENVADTYSSAKSYKKWNAMDNIARKKEYLTNLVGVSLKNPMMVELLEDNRELTERCNELMQKFDELSKSLDSLGTTMSFPISLPTIWESEENISETVASEVYETMSFPISLPTIWESEENISETVASEAYESPDIIEESDSISSLQFGIESEQLYQFGRCS